MSCDATDPLRTGQPARRESPTPRMAKAAAAHLPSGEKVSKVAQEREKKEAFGRVLRTVQQVLGKNRDEMADLLGVDPRQLGRWYEGTETPQMYRYHAIPKVREVYRLIDALDDTNATVEVQIKSKLDFAMTEKVG